jgi:hypothetical protein
MIDKTHKPLRILAGGLLWAGLVTNCHAQSPGCSSPLSGPGCPEALWVPKHCPEGCPRFPLGAIPRPAGIYVRQWQAVQIDRANLDDFVIYGNEWYKGGFLPGPGGQRHLGQIVKRLPFAPFRVVIQPDLQPEKNEPRRLFVIKYLAAHGISDAAQRVIVEFPEAEGLYGDEAIRIYPRMFTTGGTGGGGAGGIGTTGLGGGSLGASPAGGFGTIR